MKKYSVDKPHKPYKYFEKAIDLDLYDELIKEIQLNREKIPVTYSDQPILERRETAWQTNTNISAKYSGKIMHPVPFTPLVLKVKQEVEKIIGITFDSVLIFHYVDASDSMGYHFDTEGVSLGDDIVGVTFGSSRKLGIRNNETNEKEFFNVGNGDIFYMFGDCQKKYKHAIFPADSSIENPHPRLALTFRNMNIEKS
ncbi:2OG-Fe(II) oxygenase superfamily protein [Cotonvirus japonicus]|uniref:2OG-Fe(II) oxygenase superfamily protein n=1 Tax=Cotonvirus japonicus TaxID=2811091 RepID=A0ABM7NSN0_9VIRU|nr:2OG-Fe(II) oxygenase superfamily protein [Cotonvirus japonicus]BCS83153.1 2OG-Fe(II) oxygenase superfamily protein [Cotonvirus japonicus]